jgi:hypothetical protein
MNAPVSLPAIFAGIRSRKDKSYRLEFDTQELPPEDAAQLLALHQAYCALIVAPSEADLADIDIPDVAPNPNARKTQAQRIRGVLFVWWKQLGSSGDFEDFYRQQTERIIETVKSRLDGGELL